MYLKVYFSLFLLSLSHSRFGWLADWLVDSPMPFDFYPHSVDASVKNKKALAAIMYIHGESFEWNRYDSITLCTRARSLCPAFCVSFSMCHLFLLVHNNSHHSHTHQHTPATLMWMVTAFVSVCVCVCLSWYHFIVHYINRKNKRKISPLFSSLASFLFLALSFCLDLLQYPDYCTPSSLSEKCHTCPHTPHTHSRTNRHHRRPLTVEILMMDRY